MPRVVIWPEREGQFLGGSACAARELVNRLTAGNSSPRPAEACWLQRFLEESI
jgi:hypothetical protein